MVEDVSLYLSSEDHVLASLKQSKGQWEENQGSENQRGSGHGHTWGTQQGGHSFSFVLTFCLFLCFLLVCLVGCFCPFLLLLCLRVAGI